MIRIVLPFHLQTLARCEREVQLEVDGVVTTTSVLDALEACFPMLKGTIREHVTQKRRPKVRFYACGRDITHDPPDEPLPDAIANGAEPFMVIGAISGG